jgi:hypothetical protein
MIRHFVITVALGSICVMGCASNRSTESPDDIWTYEVIQVAFETNGWRLFFGARGEVGEPIEAFLHLYAQRDGDIVVIDGPQDMTKLKGLSVRSKVAALSYVRLFTQAETFMLFSFPNAIERNEDAAEVTAQDGAFLVVRRLVFAEEVEGKGHPLVAVKERVTFDGKYTLVAKDVVDYLSSEAADFPVLE